MSPEPVAILMATFNGAPFIRSQVASLKAQTHTNWRLWVSDDGSSDDTLSEVRRCAGRRLYRVTRGPGAGFAQNFLHLLRQVPTGQYVAFCDQDDVWHRTKLSRALGHLRQTQGPAMVCAATQPCDVNLKPIGQPTHETAPQLGFENALGQNVAAGNTIVLNPAAVARLKSASMGAWDIPAHDWWTYLSLSATGARMVFDPVPALLYRQHGSNMIGTNTGWRARAQRLRRLADGTYSRWITANLAALHGLRPQMPQANRVVYDQFCQSRGLPLPKRLQSVWAPPVQLARPPAQRIWQMAYVLGRA